MKAFLRTSILGAPMIALALAGCVKSADSPRYAESQKPQKKCFSIVNGVTTDKWPEVALLAKLDGQGRISSTCSGTFLSDTTVITAAHCVEDSVSGGVIYLKGHHLDLTSQSSEALVRAAPRSVKLITNSRDIASSTSTTNNAEQSARDVAVLIFPAGTSPTWLTIRASPFKYGEDVTVIGFGLTEVPEGDPSGSGVFDRRIGFNKIFEPADRYKNGFTGLVSIVGRAKTIGQPQGDSISSSGDSGGPLLVGRELIGVLSSGYLRSQLGQFQDLTQGAEAGADYVDLNSDASKLLLSQAKAQGAVFADPPALPTTTGSSSDAKDRDKNEDEGDDKADDACADE